MEFLCERFVHLKWWQKLGLGGLAVSSTAALITGCSSAHPDRPISSIVQACSFTYETVGNDTLRVTTAGVPDGTDAKITRIEVFEEKDISKIHQITAIGSTITFHINFSEERIHVFGDFGNFVPSENPDVRGRQSMHPTAGVVLYKCDLSDSF